MREVSFSGGGLEFKLSINDCTYEPAEDSELAVEAMSLLAERGRRYDSVIDVGAGSGILALAARRILRARRVAAVDAMICPATSARENLPPDVMVVVCPYASCIRGPWDLAVVNPPYLPEHPPRASVWDCSLEAGWAGGGGVMESLIRSVARLAREVLAVSSTLSPVRLPSLLSRLGFNVELLASRPFFMERVEVYWGWRS
ncbi:MAG: 50S ribosomal protein L11 methyltransferase [Desulfurococcales archaeon]|nr:50S ribosomal protein L11 methyltransferase [Desulfurococcales archaeon]